MDGKEFFSREGVAANAQKISRVCGLHISRISATAEV